MLIALLAVLGVNLSVVVALLGFVLVLRRWVRRQPGSFRGVLRRQRRGRRSFHEVERGYRRWVRDLLVWTKAPFLFRNELQAADDLDEQRRVRPHEIKPLGDNAVVVQLRIGSATVEVDADESGRVLLVGPYREPVSAELAPEPAPLV
jgi:hypothetical protein